MTPETLKTAESYSKQARRYEQRWKEYLLHTHHIILSEIDLEEGERVLDLSSGTGLLAQLLQNRKNSEDIELVLNDISEGMHKISKQRMEETPGISFTRYNATNLGFDNSSFDHLVCLNAFHNYNRQEKALTEMNRVLKPGGRLYILDWNRKGLFRFIEPLIRLFSNETIQAISADQMSTGLLKHSFTLDHRREWYFKYWNFFFVKASV